jgi:hypothetical protein
VREVSLSLAVVPDEKLCLPPLGEGGAKRRKGAARKQNRYEMIDIFNRLSNNINFMENMVHPINAYLKKKGVEKRVDIV